MGKLLCVAIPVLGWAIALARDSKPLSDAGTTTCETPDSGGGIGAWVTSRAGFAAAPEIRAKVTGRGKERHCTTSWILHLRQKDGRTHSITVAEREDVPEDNEWMQENSFEIRGWSLDGSTLLTSLIEAQGDWDETTAVIYDFDARKHWRVPLYPLFKELIQPECYVVYRPLRFAQNGEVLVWVSSTDNDREPGTNACFGESLWRLDFRHNSIARVSPKHLNPKKRHSANPR